MNRPARKTPTTPPPARPAPGARPEKAELEELISKIKDLVSESPEKAARILGDWNTRAEAKSPDSGVPVRRVRRKAG
jgi:hypothetical protein